MNLPTNPFMTPRNRMIAIIVGSLVLVLLVFQAGISVGYHKARFSYDSGNRMYRVIQGNERPGEPFFNAETAHGATGRVVSVNLPEFLIASPDNVEKTIRVSSSTIVRKFRTQGVTGDIHVDDYALVLGDPDMSGRIQAKFIRVMPASSSMPASVK